MVQTLSGRDATEDFHIASVNTTGDIVIGGAITSGEIGIGKINTRTGPINIGNSIGTGTVTIDAGSSTTQILGSQVRLANTVVAQNINSTVSLMDDVTTGNVTIAGGTTSGTLVIGGSGSRTGAITIGNNAANGAVNIYSDNSIIVGTDSCPVFVCNSSSRINGITIGHPSSSGTIQIDAGSSALNLGGSNYVEGTWTPGVSDASGNAGTVANLECNYSRLGNMVTCSIFMQITSKGSMVAGDVFRITGLPFAAGNSIIGGTMHGPFLNGAPTGMYRVVCNSTSTIAKIRINDSVAPLNRDVLVSDTVTGYIFGSFTFWVA
jgi:hypothetical protein